MIGRVRMFGHVAIRRTIATQRYAAGLAGSQMHPRSANFDALHALAHFRLFHGANRIEVRTTAIAHVDLWLLVDAKRA